MFELILGAYLEGRRGRSVMARALYLSTVYKELLGRISASGETELPRKLVLSMDEFLFGRIAGDLFRTRERVLQKVFIRVLVGIN